AEGGLWPVVGPAEPRQVGQAKGHGQHHHVRGHLDGGVEALEAAKHVAEPLWLPRTAAQKRLTRATDAGPELLWAKEEGALPGRLRPEALLERLEALDSRHQGLRRGVLEEEPRVRGDCLQRAPAPQ